MLQEFLGEKIDITKAKSFYLQDFFRINSLDKRNYRGYLRI